VEGKGRTGWGGAGAAPVGLDHGIEQTRFRRWSEGGGMVILSRASVPGRQRRRFALWLAAGPKGGWAESLVAESSGVHE